MDESKPPEEIRNWEHPPWYGLVQFEERSRWLSWRIRRVSSTTSRLTSGCRWSDKRFLVHVGKLHIPPSLEPRVKLFSPREESFPIPLKYIDVTRTTHTNLDVKQERRIDDYWNIGGSRDLSDPWTCFTQITLLATTKLLTDICGPGGDWRENSSHPGQIIYGQSSGNQWESMPSWRKSKSGLRKGFTLKTLENCVGSISSTPRIQNLKKPSRTHVRSWKHQWLLLCPAKLRKIVGVVHPTKFRRNLRVFWKLINTQECVWEITALSWRRYCMKRWKFITAL